MAHRSRCYQGKPPRRRRTPIDPPFDVMQPLERYRLHHSMSLDAFIDYLGISKKLYLGLIVADDVPLAIKEQIGRRLRVPRWLVSECAQPPPEEREANIDESLTIEDDGSYYIRDEETGEFIGPFYEHREILPPERDVPLQELQLATAVARLNGAHQDRQDADYPRVRDFLEQRIRAYLGLGPSEAFDAEQWAEETFYVSLPRIRQVGAERDAQGDA